MTTKEFWPVYLALHSKRSTQFIHAMGTVTAWIVAINAAIVGAYWLLPFCPLYGYLAGFFGHAFFEHNMPASFKHPLLSVWADHRLTWLMMTGEL